MLWWTWGHSHAKGGHYPQDGAARQCERNGRVLGTWPALPAPIDSPYDPGPICTKSPVSWSRKLSVPEEGVHVEEDEGQTLKNKFMCQTKASHPPGGVEGGWRAMDLDCSSFELEQNGK